MTEFSSEPLLGAVLPYTMLKTDQETETGRCILPAEVKAAIPPLHTQDTFPDGELRTYVKLTCEGLGLTWFLLELHEDGDSFFAYCMNEDTEQFGYFSFDDLDDRRPETLTYDASFTSRLLVDAVQAERCTRCLPGEPFGRSATDALASPRGYYYAARYDRPSPQVFATIRLILYEERPDLSVYTIQLGGDFYIVVIGDQPAERVHVRIMEALKTGTITIIPYDLLLQLYARTLAANQKGGWSEEHHTIVLKRKHKQKSQKNKRRRRGR